MAAKLGAGAPLVKVEQAKRPKDATLKRLDKLKTWRKNMAEEIKVESDIILPKSFLNILSEYPPKNLDELKSIMRDSPNRFATYGDQIYSLIGG